MNLLFTRENFSEQFKELLGFVDADISFRRMKSALEAATEEIVDLIGEETYQKAENEQKDSEFRKMLSYIIALRGYIIYAPTADLAVTNNGRLMRRDEHMVSAFEWQIEANDEALEQLYYKHLDRLLKYLNRENFPINLKKYHHSELLIPSLEVFEQYFNIGGSYYLYLKLLPALKEFEKNEWLPRSQSLDKGGERNESLEYLLLSSAVAYAMAWGLKRLNIQLFPKGVLQYSKASGGNKKRGDKLEYLETAMLFEKEYAEKLKKIENLIKKKSSANDLAVGSVLDFGFTENDGFVDL